MKARLAVALAALVLIGTGTSARADFAVKITVGSDSITVHNDSSATLGTVTYKDTTLDATLKNTISVSGTLDGYTFAVTAANTNSPGTSSHGKVTLTTNSLVNDSATAGSTFKIEASADGFTAPTPPVILTGKVTSQASPFTGTTTNQFTNQVFLDANANDGLFKESGSGVTANGVQTVKATDTSLPANTRTDNINFTTNYSLTVSNVFTLAAHGDEVDGGGGIADVTPTPAPAAHLLAVSALPFLGLFGWYRRRPRVA